MSLDRMNTQSGLMDELDYSYQSGTNQLTSVEDLTIPSPGIGNFEGAHNYTYNVIGQMTQDDDGSTPINFDYDVYGKVAKITE